MLKQQHDALLSFRHRVIVLSCDPFWAFDFQCFGALQKQMFYSRVFLLGDDLALDDSSPWIDVDALAFRFYRLQVQ